MSHFFAYVIRLVMQTPRYLNFESELIFRADWNETDRVIQIDLFVRQNQDISFQFRYFYNLNTF